jgi:hypothetical protein
MINFKCANYTIIENIIFLLQENRVEVPISENEKEYEICCEEERVGFNKRLNGDMYCRKILKSEIKNVFFAQTFAMYKNTVVKVFKIKKTVYNVWVTTTDIQSEKFGFMNMGNYFGKEVSITDFEKIWEERKPSDLDFPYPEGLSEIEEIKF